MTRDDSSYPGWPISLRVDGRPVVVVGAGKIAARKIEPLLELGALVTVVAPDVGDEVQAWSDAQRLAVEQRGFEPSDLDGAWLAVTATDDPAVNRAVKVAADERRIFTNSADDPENCSFTLLSTVRRGDVVVGIGTGGRSPALAKHLRAQIEAELGPEYEVLIELLAAERQAIRAQGRSTEDSDWQRAFDEGILVLIREGRIDEAKELLRSCL